MKEKGFMRKLIAIVLSLLMFISMPTGMVFAEESTCEDLSAVAEAAESESAEAACIKAAEQPKEEEVIPASDTGETAPAPELIPNEQTQDSHTNEAEDVRETNPADSDTDKETSSEDVERDILGKVEKEEKADPDDNTTIAPLLEVDKKDSEDIIPAAEDSANEADPVQEEELNNEPEDKEADVDKEQIFDQWLGSIHVIVEAGGDAFPEGTSMELSTVNNDAAANSVMEATNMLVTEVIAVDISFYDSEHNEVEPSEPVNVTISSSVIAENSDPVVLHIDDNGQCDIPAILEETSDAVTIETRDFSVYAVAYTVDFHYEGLSFSIAGKSSILLSSLLNELGIGLDLSFIENVVFSNDGLVQVTSSGNDWTLTSLNPFSSNEILTLILINGTEISIAVTDAQDASAYFHAQITSNKDTYASGSTAIYSVKYTIDRGNIHEGDYIYVTVPPDLIGSADLSVSFQHFSSVENLGNGQYKLTFAAGAESALTGSFSMFLTTAEVEEQKTGTITVGNDSSSITVNPKGPSGPGIYTDTINKDAADNGSAVLYGDYDYSEGYGDSAAQIGVLQSYPGSIKYRLYVNSKEAEISNIVVTDVLPAGMEFDLSKPVEVSDRHTGDTIDPGLYSVSISGNTLVFSYPGTLTTTLQINYWVNLVSSNPLAGKYTNRADITYEQGGTPYAEHRNYILQGSDYSAANGEKSVDKTEISTDPGDQLVTYTIKFWNQSGFSAGDIELDDYLDPYVHFISANSIEYFSIIQDEENPQIIHLENIKDISGTTTVYVRFICDFSDVPVGYTVENVLGGNITKTRKIGGEAVISARKTVDGSAPSADQKFDFELLDSSGTPLQVKQNSGAEVSFEPISYGKDDLGKTYTYMIREKADQETDYVIDNAVYTVTVTVASEADEDGVINTNVAYQKNGEEVAAAVFDNKSAKTEVSVTKIWSDSNDQDGIRPNEVTIKLLADGEDTGKTLVLNEGNRWTGSFTELDQYAAGKEIVYTVEEADVSGYTTVIIGTQAEGYTVTNSHTPETTEVTGSKTWNDSDDQDGKRPQSITIRLLADGTEIESRTVTAEDNWTWSFTGLPKNKDGQAIIYSVKEDAVPEYSTEYDGTDVINTYAPKKTSVTVTKAWSDSEDQDGIRPNEVTIKLLADGENTGKTLVLNEGNRWTGSFTELDQYAAGKEIVYAVEETVVSGYTTVITGTQAEGYTVTNSHTPETTEVTGSKTWNDSDDQDGKRPESITIRLLADGTEVGSKTVTAEDDWAWSFTDLPKNNEGREIIYSITEDAVPDYAAEITRYNITNTYTPSETSLSVTKVWDDDQNKDGIRPAGITVILFENGKTSGRTDAKVELNASNHWTYTWNHLPEKAEGKSIEYSVDEENAVDGYSKTITGSMEKGYTITNTHAPAKPERSYNAVKSSDTAGQEVKPGDQITYTITIRNTGNTTLTGIWIRDYIPDYTKYISAGQNGARGAIDGRQHVDWFIEQLDVGQSTQVTFTVEVVSCIPDNTTIRNTAFTEDTEKPEKPSLNKPENPKNRTNEIIHYYKPDRLSLQGGRPKTGDSSNITGYVLAMIFSGLALMLLVKRKKRA